MTVQKIKIISYRGKDGKDSPDLKPFVTEQLKSLESDLKGLVISYQDSQNLSNGIVDSSIREIEQKVSEIDSIINSKVASSDFSELQKQLAKFIENLNVTISSRASKAELELLRATIPNPINVLSGSENVQVTKENDTFKISVDVQEKITETVIREVGRGGGISKSKVEQMISSALSGYTPGTSGDLSAYTLLSTTASISGDLQNQINAIVQESTVIASSGGSILVTQNGNDFNLEVASAPVSNHNSLLGLQGGTSGQYYHLTATEYASISGSSGSYVPYTGATTDVNLGTHKINVDAISFNQSPVTAVAPRQITWNDTDKTFDMGLTSEVTLQVGQESLTRVYNGTASTITNGQPVYITGITNDNPSVALASAIGSIGEDPASACAGIATESIAPSGTGFITSKGKVRGLNTSGYTTGQTIYLGETTGTFTAETSGFAFSSHINPLGYIGLVDAISGSVYVDVRDNESSLLSLSERETNIILGNSASTGVYEYTGMTIATSASFTIAPIKGWIIENTGVYATQPYVTNVIFDGGTFPVTNIATQQQTYVLIDSNNQIQQIPNFPTATQRRQMIFLGKVVHNNLSSINTINNTVDYDTSPFSAVRDMFAPISILNGGVTIAPNGTNKSIARNAGTLYGLGINWTNDETNPNSVALSGQPLVTIRSYVTRSTLIASNQTLIDPAKYDLNGTLTAVGGGSNTSTNQRVYQFPNGNIVVQYGQTTYANLAAAVAGIATESFVPYPNTIQSAVLIAYLSLVKTASNLSNTAHCIITPGGLFGQPTGGTSNISTGTLQQAYDNSIQPEIVINATLDGLTIKNGTGNADNVTHLLEGQNTAGTVTSFIMADGTFHSAYSIVNSISGASGSIVTHDASGKLLDSGILATSLATNSTVASISGGLNTRLTTVENNYATKASPISGTYNNVVVNSQGIVTSGGNFSYALTSSIPTSATFLADYDARYVNENDLSSTLNNYTLLSTTASISGSLLANINTRALDSAVVHTTGNETIAGVKTFSNLLKSSGGIAIGSSSLLGSERLRVSAGTMGTPGATDVIVAEGKVYAGDTSATSIQTAGGVTCNDKITIDSTAQNKWLMYKTSGVTRFAINTGTAESGSNIGCDLLFNAYTDAGALIGTPIFLKRSTASVAMGTNAVIGSERLRVAGGTMGTPTSTDVLVAAGAISCGAGITAAGNITTSSISGASGSIVTHDAVGKLLDSGILATSLATNSTVASISGSLQSQISAITVPTSASFLGGYDARYVNVSGDTMTGNLVMSAQTSGGYYMSAPKGTGARNEGFGNGALASVTTGAGNTAFGYEALKVNTTNNNTAIGDKALVANTTGYSNTVIGAEAGLKNVNGYNNTAVGLASLGNNVSGASNTAIGYAALYKATDEKNTAVGYYALYNCSSGKYNTSVGTDALNACTTGWYNTSIGYRALNGVTTESNCSAIGYNAQVTAGNQVQLGDSSTTTYVYGTVQNRSDVRDKTDIRDTVLGLDFILQLRPVDFKWDYREDYISDENIQQEKDGSKKRNRYHHGIIAQEVAEVIQETGVDFGGYQDHSINGGKDVKSIGYDELIAPLIKAIQQQHHIIEELKARITSLEA